MKNFILVIILVCCFLIGFYIKNYYILRKNTYKKLCLFIQKLSNLISFNNEKLNIIVLNEKEEERGQFKKFLENYEKFLNSKLNNNFLQETKKTFYFLSPIEVNFIVKNFISIGGKTKEEEIESLNNFLYVLKEKCNIEINKCNKFANLYFKLFVILGFVLFVIFL